MRFVSGVAVVAIAGTARADFSQIDIKARPWGSTGAWSDALVLDASSGSTSVEVGVFYHRAFGYGMRYAIHNIVGYPYSAAQGDAAVVLDDNPTSALHPDGRIGTYNWGGQRQLVYHTGTSGVDANRFRIADRANADDVIAGGISLNQDHPDRLGTNFDTSNPSYCYHFKLTLSAVGGPRTVTIDAPWDRIKSFKCYETATSTIGTDLESTLIPTDPATVTVSFAPAPASLALLLCGGLAAQRRRRELAAT